MCCAFKWVFCWAHVSHFYCFISCFKGLKAADLHVQMSVFCSISVDALEKSFHQRIYLFLKDTLSDCFFFFLLCFSCSYSPSALMAVTMLLLHPEVRLWGTREDHHECRNLLQVGSGRWAPRRARRHGGHHVHGPQPLDPSKWLQVRSPEDHGATQGLRQKDVPAGEGPHRTAAHHWDQASVHHGYWCEQSGATDTILRARAACIYSLFLFQDCVQLNQYKMNKEIGKVSVDIPVIAEVLKF